MTNRPASTRLAHASDVGAVSQLAAALWPDAPVAEHRDHAAAILSGEPPSTMPLVLFVAELEGEVVGFIEVGLRSHADGCDATRPVGFIEGWYVEPERRASRRRARAVTDGRGLGALAGVHASRFRHLGRRGALAAGARRRSGSRSSTAA